MACPVARICAEFMRFLLVVLWPLCDYISSIVYRLFMGKTEKLPPIKDNILLLSATELAEQIRKKKGQRNGGYFTINVVNSKL
ncbi:hypothetical protein CEXT_572811 [Caerostris extrusa]|uniref:Uncharacterized protein n=1 Tax=Caerostris extrusa TaxID=172846 RepID=A0AAV4VMW5_CAEEX|nr:hypothetical protein CEXT_572811 [Caerostris extrusa]